MKIKIDSKKLETAVRELASDVDGRITVSSRCRLGTINGHPLIIELTAEDDDPPPTTARFEAVKQL